MTFEFLSQGIRILQPIVLGLLLDYFRKDTDKTYDDAILYASYLVGLNGNYQKFRMLLFWLEI